MNALGIDLGTSAVKAVIIDGEGAVVARSSAPLTISRPHPTWSEQHPEDWWQAAVAAVTALPADTRRAVGRVGLAGQMHGAVLLDAHDRVLRPAILWNDGRAAAECLELEARVPGSRIITGNVVMPGFTAPKLLWVRAHEPSVAAKLRRVLLPKDYLRLRLTGDHATDMSDASGTMWLDPARRAWSDTMLAACGLTTDAMPSLFEGPEVTGSVTAAAADMLGIGRVPVVAGGGDNAAAAVATGMQSPGDAMLSLGTSGVIFVVTDRFAPRPENGVHAFCHALPELWHLMSVSLSAGDCLDWVSRLTGQRDVAAALALAAAADARDDAPLFLPYLSGERTPHNDPRAKGVFFGLTHASDAAAMICATLEGVAFALRDGLDALSTSGQPIGAIRLAGGGTRSRYWMGLLAAALDRPLGIAAGADLGPALGAARLALSGAAGSPYIRPAADGETIVPDPRRVERLGPRYRRYRALYPALAGLF